MSGPGCVKHGGRDRTVRVHRWGPHRYNNLHMISPLRRAEIACITFFICVCAILVALNRPAAYASSAGKRERGANLFLTRGCVRCHSITGVGGSRAPDLGSVGLRRQAPQIKKQILNGGHGMPPFKDVLTKDQVKDLVAFLTSCRTSMAPGCRTWMPAEPSQ